ncbi:hypothetical protein C0991_007149 [Blastosporella zonata]|nr:hypothetical protein C0991_007149 [Blastosporella zonata]
MGSDEDGIAQFAIEKFSSEPTGRFIVKLKDGVSKASVLASLNSNTTHDWNLMNGLSGHFSGDAVGAVRAFPDVEYITEDGKTELFTLWTRRD